VQDEIFKKSIRNNRMIQSILKDQAAHGQNQNS
jgi:hypothetical protein